MRVLLTRAVDRGEATAGANVEILAQVLPSMAAFRVIVGGQAIDQDFLMALADAVLLPALHVRPAGEPHDQSATMPVTAEGAPR